jgi:uncharacterized damage-inducible protein DinB
MRLRACTIAALVAIVPSISSAQAVEHSAPSNPVAQGFRDYESSAANNLIAAAEEFPADKYSFKPTPAQMSVADIIVHLARGNDFFCSSLSGGKAPTRTKIAATDGKDVLLARLKETFAYCATALANVDDSKLSEMLPFFGGRSITRASMLVVTAADFADHYSQLAIYLRLNGLLPPTAKRPE